MNWCLFTPFQFQILLHLTIYWLKENECMYQKHFFPPTPSIPQKYPHTHTQASDVCHSKQHHVNASPY